MMKEMLLACFGGMSTVQASSPAHLEAFPPEARDAIDSARHKHRQSVMPLNPPSRPYNTPEELVQIGVEKARELAQQVRSTLESELEPGMQQDRRLHVGQVIHDAVMHYFHAGLNADNKARLADDGATLLGFPRYTDQSQEVDRRRQVLTEPPTRYLLLAGV